MNVTAVMFRYSSVDILKQSLPRLINACLLILSRIDTSTLSKCQILNRFLAALLSSLTNECWKVRDGCRVCWSYCPCKTLAMEPLFHRDGISPLFNCFIRLFQANSVGFESEMDNF